jgi:hypothetical protein
MTYSDLEIKRTFIVEDAYVMKIEGNFIMEWGKERFLSIGKTINKDYSYKAWSLLITA